MKKNSTYWVEFQQYHKPEAQVLIEQTKQQLSQSAKEAGRRDAESNLPKKGDSLRPYLEHLLSQVQQLILNLRNLHKAEEDVSLAVEKQHRVLQQARNERDELQPKHAQVMREYQNHASSFPSTMAIIIAVIILLLGLMEGLIALNAIRAFVPQYFTALFTSLIYGLCLTILAHQVLIWWNMITKQITRIVIRALIICDISAAFFLMGVLRSGQLNMATIPMEESLSGTVFTYADPMEALLFMCISWVVFLPAILLAKLSPTKDQWLSIFKARKLSKAVRKSEKNLQRQHERISRAENEIGHLKQFEISRNQAAQRDEEEAESLIAHIKAHYVQSNIRHRIDKGSLPKCFEGELHYPLCTYFQNTKNSKR